MAELCGALEQEQLCICGVGRRVMAPFDHFAEADHRIGIACLRARDELANRFLRIAAVGEINPAKIVERRGVATARQFPVNRERARTIAEL